MEQGTALERIIGVRIVNGEAVYTPASPNSRARATLMRLAALSVNYAFLDKEVIAEDLNRERYENLLAAARDSHRADGGEPAKKPAAFFQVSAELFI
jgi:hypothetical protein